MLDFGAGVLRRPRAADAERITAICQDPAIQRFTRVPIPYTLATLTGAGPGTTG